MLGRLTADIVTTLGSGVDGAVRRLGYSFDTAGRPFQQTSFSDMTGLIVVNQVQDAYNGYGQRGTGNILGEGRDSQPGAGVPSVGAEDGGSRSARRSRHILRTQ